MLTFVGISMHKFKLVNLIKIYFSEFFLIFRNYVFYKLINRRQQWPWSMVVEYTYAINVYSSSLIFWVQILPMARCARYSFMWSSLSVTCACRWLSPGAHISFINKTNRHDIAEILLKVALNTITLTQIYHTVLSMKERQHNGQKKKNKQRTTKHYT